MSLKAPRFWFEPGSTAGFLLAPVAAFYDAVSRTNRALQSPQEIEVPVICVGNLVTGGQGKTPVSIAIARLLSDRDPAFLSRGYGGHLPGPTQVDPARHTAYEVGDEPLLLARTAPTWMSADRATGGRMAVTAGAQLIIMDDGLQNRTLRKDISLIVVDGGTGFGNGRVMPAGPLRETVDDGLKRADAVVIVGEDRTNAAGLVADRVPVFHARLAPTPEADDLRGRKVLAFAGIGRPDKFFETLTSMRCDIVARHAFADHEPYTPERIMELCENAAAAGAVPVTTEKDLVRMPAGARDMVRAVPVEIAWEDAAGISAFLTERLRAARSA